MNMRVAAVGICGLMVSMANAQSCDPQWLSGTIPFPNGPVYSTVMWDRDGAGPLPPALVIGGSFTLAGTVAVSNLALWDGIQWFDIGGGVSGTVHGVTAINALAVMPNGDLVVAGLFDNAGTGGGAIVANCIARFSGTAWASMGNGTPNLSSSVTSLTVRPNGDLVALGGIFSNLDNSTAGPLARWNDATAARWSDLPVSPPNMQAYRTVYSTLNGDLIVGGVAGANANSSAIWRWSESLGVWTGFGSGINGTDPRWQVFSILELSNGDIVAAGNFLTAGGVPANSIARWNGSQWFPYGSGITYPTQIFRLAVRAVAQMPNGDIIAGGEFDTAGGNVGGRIARWNGSTWTRLGQGAGDIVWTLLRMPSNELAIGGVYLNAGGSFSNKRIARYSDNPAPWVALQPVPQSIAHDAAVSFAAAPATGFTNVSYRWQRNGVDIQNGAGGASPGGGTVTGATGSLASPTTGSPVTLSITGSRQIDSGTYTAIFTNSCGSGLSLPAMLTVGSPSCSADFNGDSIVDFFDYLDFVDAFSSNLPAADFNGDLVIDFFDYLDFVDAFSTGC